MHPAVENVEARLLSLSLEGDMATVQACVSWPVILCCLGVKMYACVDISTHVDTYICVDVCGPSKKYRPTLVSV